MSASCSWLLWVSSSKIPDDIHTHTPLIHSFPRVIHMSMQITLGFIFGIVISFVAFKLGSLNKSGAVAASISGGLIFGFGGLPWAVLLLTFFISSSLLSKAFRERKQKISEKFSKGSKRDWAQVAANGGLGALLVICHFIQPDNGWSWIAFAGAMATVNADTWATEIGVLSRKSPILITTGERVDPGTSGAVTWLGTGATIAGALLVGVLAAIFSGGLPIILAAAFGGLVGSIFDSVLGATIQAIYYCPTCQKETERHPTHTCGTSTHQIRGWKWLDNDLVNFSASAIGAVTTVLAYWLTG